MLAQSRQTEGKLPDLHPVDDDFALSKGGLPEQGKQVEQREHEIGQEQLPVDFWEDYLEDVFKKQLERPPIPISAIDVPANFIRALINIVDRYDKTTQADNEPLLAFLSIVQQEYFSSSSSIFSFCAADQVLPLALAANGRELIRGWFGQTMVNDVVHRFSYASEYGWQALLAGIKHLNLGETLDLINFLQTVGAQAAALGSYARPAKERVASLLNTLKGEGQSPYLKYAVALSEDRLLAEYSDPTLEVFTYRGNETAGRLPEMLEEEVQSEDELINHRYVFDPPVPLGHRVVRGAANALTELDRTNQPVRYGFLPAEPAINRTALHSAIDGRTLARMIEWSDQAHIFSPRAVIDSIYTVTKLAWKPLVGPQADLDSLASTWQEKTGVLSVEEWRDIVEVAERLGNLSEQLGNRQAELHKRADDDNEAASLAVLQEIALAITSEDEATASFDDETAAKLVTVLRAGDVEYAFALAERLFALWRLFPPPPEVRGLLQSWQNLGIVHDQNWQRAEADFNTQADELAAVVLSSLPHLDRAIKLAAEHGPAIQQGVRQSLTDYEKEIRANLPMVKLERFHNVIDDVYAIPFVAREMEQPLPTLLAQLHRPKMKRLIEQDLAIDLNSLQLNTQLQLLAFLAEGTPETLARVRGVLQSDASYKQEFLTAFLATAGDYQFGNRLIDLTTKYDDSTVKDIFSAYSQLATSAEQVRAYLTAHCATQFDQHPDVEGAIVRGLLRSGKQMLEVAASERMESAILLDQLDTVDADIQLMANTYKELIKAGEMVDITQLPGVEIAQVVGGALDTATSSQLLNIARQNWQPRPHMYDAVINDLEEALHNPQTTFHLVKQKGKVIGFFRLDQTGEEALHFGSVNIKPEARGYALTNVLMQQMLAKEIAGKEVTAHCDPWDPVTEQYLATGFYATQMVDYSGQPAFEIKYSLAPPSSAVSRADYQELLERQISGDQQIKQYTFSKDPVNNPGDSENDRFMADVRRRVNNGSEVVINYRFGPKNPDGSVPVLVAFAPDPRLVQTTPGASWPDKNPQ